MLPQTQGTALRALPKPQVLDVYEWEQWWQQRAELMTLAPGSPCYPTDTLRHTIDLPDVAARLLHRIDKGDHPDLAAPLRKLVETL